MFAADSIVNRTSGSGFKRARIVAMDAEENEALHPDLNDLSSQFDFVPIHRIYTYDSSGVPVRTMVVAEINLLSGVRPDAPKRTSNFLENPLL